MVNGLNMNTYDTYKAAMPLDKGKFEPEVLMNAESSLFGFKLPLGISAINFYDTHFTIEGSSKILHENYLSGISIETISQVIDNINNSGVVLLDKDYFINDSLLLKIDQCHNVITDDPSKLIKVLYDNFVKNKHFIRDYIKNNEYETLNYSKCVKTKKSQRDFKVYDKFKELKGIGNKEIREYLGYEKLMDCKKIARFELRLNSVSKIRNDLLPEMPTATKPKFIDVLSSNKNPVKKQYDSIYNLNNNCITELELSKGIKMKSIFYKENLDRNGIANKKALEILKDKLFFDLYENDKGKLKSLLIDMGYSNDSANKILRKLHDNLDHFKGLSSMSLEINNTYNKPSELISWVSDRLVNE